ncbi:hypothetical protein CDL15_Pgr006283 [Punica granatum]|uniref:VQ domain-containing protein n=1 Tax=Punica granatum TaxID=22663 RepID=A0A218X5G8_PUNGR|nr:hypothetical protein CDL15_Pgr006283 [Punica granatum]
MASRSAESSSSAGELSGNGNRESYSLKHLNPNKLSHKISKPLIRKPTALPNNLEPLLPNLTQPAAAATVADQSPPPHQPPQPPVYNISKSDFRDVVQRLTGAPPHDPPPQQQQAVQVQLPRPPASSSRLHRIRPPPLAQLSARPSPLMHCPVDPSVIPTSDGSGNPIARPVPPMSPLPPLPGVHLAAESPVSAYMRRLRGSSTDSRPNQPSCLSPLAPPRWPSELGTIPPGAAIGSQPQSQHAASPLSPLPYRLIPPVPLFPPTSPSQLMGFPFPQLPVSPTVPSPKP